MTNRRTTTVLSILTVLIIICLPFGLLLGSVAISPGQAFDALCGNGDAMSRFVIIETRLPALLTSLLAGAALAVAGLLMQTCFANPLAGPSIMGISSGASLGVAVVIMLGASYVGLWGSLAVAAGAFAGAMLVLGVLLLFSAAVRSSEMLLIIGILVGYLTSSIISLLNYFAPERAVHSFVLWGLGNFSSVDLSILPYFAVLCLLFIAISFPYIRSLNALLFGADYAHSAGVNVGRVRTGLLLVSGALTATVTAWCGPIGFIGLVIPHIARMALGSSNHRTVLPVTVLAGAFVGMLCQILSVLPSLFMPGNIPINAITPVIGVPVIIYVLLNRRKILYFN